jgi:hypothetical protein
MYGLHSIDLMLLHLVWMEQESRVYLLLYSHIYDFWPNFLS